ncbi:BamA/TamA family outer membrane protein [Rhodocaloribacter litoris]|uniref:BamA/TamA family outer membrane protein n=1 Tax=Rhodocaloribacter litoris TaxID=2558931 RepID=UPI0014221874|nr:BamA/TamA family outer membrane protein [Rhodocaloribacter litoris]QXD16087.1 BamA/TamA family outer membrane protein [Rhodocaloribacter litoris]
MAPRRLRIGFLSLLLLLPVLPVAGQYGYHFGRNKVQYEDFDWMVLHTEHFDIYYYPEMLELARQGAFFAEEAYRELQNRFNFSLNHRTPIIFYSSNLHFKQTNTTPGFIPDGVGGFFEFLKGRVVIPANGNLHRFRRVVRHELVHVFTYNKILRVLRDHRKPPDRFVPLWFTEGLAEYWSGPPDYQHEMVIRDALFANYLVPLPDIFRIYGSFVMYKQGEALCRFISETYGEEKLLRLIENVWVDRNFEKVMEYTLKEDYRTIGQRWEAWLKAQYYPHLEDVEAPSLLAGGVAVEGFNGKPDYFRFPDGTRKVYFVGNKTGYSNVYAVAVDERLRPVGEPEVLIHGERSDRFEAFHLLESRISISPQGKLAFVTQSGGRDVIHVYDLVADALGPTYEFEDLIAIYSPAWSPDGRRLVFSSIDRSGYSDLYVYHMDRGALQRLTDDPYDDRDPAWSPDGRWIAFSSDRTSEGRHGYYNLFTYDLETGHVRYVTFGKRHDFSPRWSPDGRHLIFTSTFQDSTGRYGPQDLWVADMTQALGDVPAVASAADPDATGAALRPATTRTLYRLTNLTTAAFDPVWTDAGNVLFTSFEGLRFTIRALTGLDSLLAYPKEKVDVDLARTGPSWAFGQVDLGEGGATRSPYKKKFKLDIAQGVVSQSPVLGTTGGAVLAFSDMLGDDHLFLTLYNTGSTRDDFLKSLSFSVARFQLHRRTNIGYGLYRFSGRRYDITDPDAPTEFPFVYETIYGGFGSVSYPISKFRRLEVSSSLNWSNKEIAIRNIDRDALLLSTGLSLVHDNALYHYNGPIDGWRGRLTLAYTTDVLYSNVSYFSLIADVRHYLRITSDVTLASWVMGRWNQGREARLYVLGGSWDLRGFPFLDVRGKKMWFTSHELRFPILKAPSVLFPILAPFGIANLRGALFFDAAHAWNDGYHDRVPEIFAGETLGSTGIGFRLNLFGAFVLRYDIGYRFRDGFSRRDKTFKQFFFGFDF